MCHRRQTIQKEWFRGTGRECRLTCMKLNNQRMESDLGFMDPSPQDLMNESLKSEFDLSFASNRSMNGSLLHRTHDSPASHHSLQLHQISSHSVGLSPPVGAMAPPQTTNESPPDSKRKYETAVTPQKDREFKRQRPPDAYNGFESEFNGVSPIQSNIHAQLRYQHLGVSPHFIGHGWPSDQQVPNAAGNPNGASSSNHPVWNQFLDMESMPE